jgi:hypothetical protein
MSLEVGASFQKNNEGVDNSGGDRGMGRGKGREEEGMGMWDGCLIHASVSDVGAEIEQRVGIVDREVIGKQSDLVGVFHDKDKEGIRGTGHIGRVDRGAY